MLRWSLLLFCPALLAQQGEIRGLVLSSGASEPLPSVEISLAPEASDSGAPVRIRRFRTAADGRFAFDSLELGAYTLGFTKDGFEAGARVSRSVLLSDDRPEAELEVFLRRSSAVNGRVLDSDGDPIADATVQLRSWNTSLGLRYLRPLKVARTDDLGEYRIHGLAPGRYIVSASSLNLQAPRGVLAYEFSGLHFPGVSDISQASTLAMAWNQDVPDIDFELPYSPPTAIEGVVFGPDGEPCGGCLINVLGPGGAIEGSVSSNDQGLFAIRGLPPGQYDLSSGGRRERGSALLAVTVTAGRPLEAALTLSESLAVSGRVTVDGSLEAAAASAVTVNLRPAGGLFGGRRLQDNADLAGEAQFEIPEVAPGEYSVTVSRLPPGAYLDRILLSGQPIPDGILRVRGESSLAGLELRLALDGGSVSGRVHVPAPDHGGPIVPEGLVVLIPAEYGKDGRYEQLASYRPTDGLFQLPGVAPGVYDLIAVPRNNTYDLGDPQDLELLRRAAEHVRVAPRAAIQADAPFLSNPD